ncbi:methanobactin export MATE transporter MbnM [Bacterioplanes sanyensis]|nr:methanobactin export MATE transporter MbnM [Bacterioplanes sanyensis]
MKTALTALLAMLCLTACQPESNFNIEQQQQLDGSQALQLSVEGGFVLPPIPDDNPLTDAKAELGRHLFYDVRLSGNGQQSCESCHQQSLAFTDGKALPQGSEGHTLVLNSQSLTNVAYNASYTWWNPILVEMEDQLFIPLTGDDPVELGIDDGNREQVLQRFRDDEQYQSLFAAAFPQQAEPVTLVNVVKALASFVRTLISDRSAFDRGELSDSALRGRELFFSEKMECFHCHNGFNFSSSTVTVNTRFPERVFFNNGLYNLNNNGSYPSAMPGKFKVTNDWADMGAFRPPTLRNIELTAPYMHDGSIATLEQVIEFYAAGGRHIESGANAGDGRINPYKSDFVSGFEATEQEKQDLINFLHSLTDYEFIRDPRFANPFAEQPDA